LLIFMRRFAAMRVSHEEIRGARTRHGVQAREFSRQKPPISGGAGNFAVPHLAPPARIAASLTVR
jgi:hypothetical protein